MQHLESNSLHLNKMRNNNKYIFKFYFPNGDFDFDFNPPTKDVNTTEEVKDAVKDLKESYPHHTIKVFELIEVEL
jgi:hypothetical protein